MQEKSPRKGCGRLQRSRASRRIALTLRHLTCCHDREEVGEYAPGSRRLALSAGNALLFPRRRRTAGACGSARRKAAYNAGQALISAASRAAAERINNMT
ncbi:hypothetical protein QF037_000486 [Streptomyces canus]|uniref:hypothetical protein n=1 Tax=Streptomyces canus TaxID=58343 RepID=UPI0027894DFB|nr:hypothetical protein [Streptomyces canus]MDQ0596141.1 hypothetical protein [Streptomyces canus]